MTERIRINWILARSSLAGGIKSNRLIAEAMARRGHDVTIAYVAKPERWPRWYELRKFTGRLRRELAIRRQPDHHLAESTARLIAVDRDHILPDDVPDADISIASFWPTREWIENWPSRKGVKAYFIRHHELHAGERARVEATYRLPGMKFVIATWLQRLMLERYGDAETILVPNGVDWRQFQSQPRARGPLPTVDLLYGEQTWKGADVAFQALEQVQRSIPELRVTTFGRVAIQPQHIALRPDHHTHHLRPAQSDISGIYRSTDCWIVPSTSEGFGMPGLEAAACRCPVVSTRCGGPEDYVNNNFKGILVPVGDAEAMARAIQRILSLDGEAWQQMSEASYEVACRFDWDRSAEILEQAILAKLAQTGAASTGQVASAAAPSPIVSTS